jgi:hypothetical protein
MDDVATTRPYYASTYVFVSRKKDDLAVASLADPRLRKLKIGVHLIGDDATPPTMALGQEGIVNNVHGYMIQKDFEKPNPPARLIEAVEKKDVDVAAVWGPLGGYFSKSSPVPLSVTPMTGTARFAPLRFQFAIAMGVREGDPLKRTPRDPQHSRALRRSSCGYQRRRTWIDSAGSSLASAQRLLLCWPSQSCRSLRLVRSPRRVMPTIMAARFPPARCCVFR